MRKERRKEKGEMGKWGNEEMGKWGNEMISAFKWAFKVDMSDMLVPSSGWLRRRSQGPIFLTEHMEGTARGSADGQDYSNETWYLGVQLVLF